MEERKAIISSPNIQDTEALFVIYLGLTGNEDKSPEDFNEFLSLDSMERKEFLDEYCDYSIETKNEQSILVFSRKK